MHARRKPNFVVEVVRAASAGAARDVNVSANNLWLEKSDRRIQNVVALSACFAATYAEVASSCPLTAYRFEQTSRCGEPPELAVSR
jgi:hypothetical protein